MPIQIRDHGTARIILLDRPPLNSLDVGLRRELLAALQAAWADPSVRSIVLGGVGRAFCAGADITEFEAGGETLAPSLPEVIAAMDGSAKPIVAAIDGVCMGGGLELALGCHRRVCTASARFALPEVKLGILPGAGGTQRLPRAIGVPAALELIVSGRAVNGEEAARLGIAQLVTGEAVASALALPDAAPAAQRLRDRPIDPAQRDADDQAIESARARLQGTAERYPAPLACVEAVQAAMRLGFDQGLASEWSLFQRLKASPTSRALRHAFLAERLAGKIPGLPASARAAPVRRAAVIGAGTMGGGIAMNFANAGIAVTVLEAQAAALEKGLAQVRRNYEASAKKGRLTADEVERRMGLIAGSLRYEDLRDADFVIEAVFEDLEVKRGVFEALDRHARADAVLASNTSTLDLDRIASFTTRPQQVIGTHFFSPANVMRLLEVVRAARTAPEVLATTLQLARTLGKVGVVAGVCDGFIGNRMLEQYLRQAYFLLDEGALPQQVDGALRRWGMAMGPLEMMDMAGQDIGYKIRQRRAVEQPGMLYSKLPDLICEMGRLGQKTGAGFYRYEAGQRKPMPDPQIERLIIDHSARIGLPRRPIADEEIVDRCILALVNEGARVLEDGIALRASDIDVVYLAGYGFPDFRGGPMFHAATLGLPAVVGKMLEYGRNRHADPGFWQPAGLLQRLAAAGRGFDD
jgi:3-hydroxyacyl-CoA dehydrogenase